MVKHVTPVVSALAIALSTTALTPAAIADGEARSNQAWWPEQLNLQPLAGPSIPASNPYGDDFDYAATFETLDLEEVKADIEAVMTTSQDWWPADLWSLWSVLHPHGLAQRRHLPHL